MNSKETRRKHSDILGNTLWCIYTYCRFPAGAVVKNSPANAKGTRDLGLGPRSGRSLEKEMATHFSTLASEIPGQRSLLGYSPWGHRVRHD